MQEHTFDKTLPSKKLRVGIIGCGRVSVMHLSSVALSDEAELVACCDVKQDRAELAAKKYGVTAYTDYKEMIRNERPDVVHVCLPHFLHVPVSVYAMEQGVHVLCEKPMSIDIESAERAVAVAERTGKQYGIIFQCRFNQSVQTVKKALQSGKLGKIVAASSVLTWSRPDSYYGESDWKGTWEYEGGGVVIDQAIHSIDLVHWLVDSPVANVCCTMANHGHRNILVEDTAEGLITYENGVRYNFYCTNNYAADEPIEIKLFCERGKVKFGYHDAYIEYNNGEREEKHETRVHIVEGGKEYWGYQHIRQIRQFYRACLGKEPPALSGKDALKTHRLICELYNKGGLKNIHKAACAK